ncbi:MAG: ATP-binding protein [Candidatus Saccharibacteria bacterium]|nr:ATP-binding protein [Candidatus Saccharibacteria bacterium]
MQNIDLLKSFFVIPFTLILVGLSFWVLLSDKKSKANKLLFVEINLLIFSMLADYLSGFFNDLTSTYLVRLSYMFLILALVMFYFFVQHFPFESTISKRHRLFNMFLIILMSVFSIVIIFTPMIVSSTSDWSNQVTSGDFAWVYYSLIVILILVSFYNMMKKYQLSSKSDREKIRFMLVGVAIYAMLQVTFNLILPILGTQKFYYLGDYSIIIFVAFTTYAIVRHHLFDVKLAIVRSVTYSLVLVTLAGIYLVIAFVISAVFNIGQSNTGQIVSGVVISLVLAFAFQPLKRFFDKITNRVFYKDNYNTDDFFAKLNKTLSITTDLRELLERVAYEIGTTLKAEQAFFFIFTKPDGHYVSAGTRGHKQLPRHDAVLFEQKSQGKRAVFEASMFDDDDPVKRMMISHRIELVLPLIQDDAVIGYLCLGEHKTSGYTHRDIKALNTISDELVIAVQNALSIHEIRELNASLQQKIANATKELRSSNAVLRRLDEIKDEFISMASHQLRTPLTSVKGYISMVIEGDAGKISPSQKQLLDQAFMSSENMVHLINDFLNVSRIQSGKFVIDKKSVDFSVLVDEEMNGLRPNATARGMKLVYKKPNKFPVVEVDEGKFRQVVMNFADNAIYYSHEDSSIIISLGVEGNEIVFTVKDTGIGVPKAEQDKLFAKFYRAANAKVQRPDGTGVGIYLAKRVIDAHGGKIIFESTEGKGSTFGFRLPIK